VIISVLNLDQKLTNDFVKFCCNQLGIKPRQLYVNGYDDISEDLKGYCIDVEDDVFTIATSTKDRNITEIYTTIAHELVHVKQYMKQNLGVLLESSVLDYYNTWWEVEARNLSVDLMCAYVGTLNKKK
jgi:hypothetical protein